MIPRYSVTHQVCKRFDFGCHHGNQIALFRSTTIQDFTEIPVHTADSEPYGIAMEADVAVWFTERDANKLGRYDGSLPPHEYWLPVPDSRPTDIVVDVEGCAWYTAPGTNRIGRFCVPPDRFIYLPLVTRQWELR